MHHRSLALALLFVSAAGCTSSSPKNQTMEELYLSSMRDLASEDGMGGLSPKVQERQEKRLQAARKAWLDEKLETAEDHLWCAAVLSGSDDMADLALAHRLALSAEEMGEPRGLPLSAELVDKQLLKRGEPQRYGTQLVFDPFLRRYRMWDLDPDTTDAERRAVGLPPLEELLARAEEADRDLGERLRSGSEPAREYEVDDN